MDMGKMIAGIRAAAQRPAAEDENGIKRTIILAKGFEVAQATRGIRRKGSGQK